MPRSSSRSRARHSARAPGTNRPRIHPSSTRHRVPVSTVHPRSFQTHIEPSNIKLTIPTFHLHPSRDTPKLTPEEIQTRLKAVPTWTLDPQGVAISRKFTAKNWQVRLRFRQPTFNRRGRRRPSPGRAPDQLEGRRGRREHARHRWAVTARLCPGGQAGHDRRHVLTEVASRERGDDEAE